MKPLSEHPNPQFERKSYLSLNGEWDYKFSYKETIPNEWDGKIIVPYSPESPLSGVNRILQPDECLYYRLIFKVDKSFVDEKKLADPDRPYYYYDALTDIVKYNSDYKVETTEVEWPLGDEEVATLLKKVDAIQDDDLRLRAFELGVAMIQKRNKI